MDFLIILIRKIDIFQTNNKHYKTNFLPPLSYIIKYYRGILPLIYLTEVVYKKQIFGVKWNFLCLLENELVTLKRMLLFWHFVDGKQNM